MKLKFSFIFLALAAFSSFVSACGGHENEVGNKIINFGVFGNIIPTLILVVLVLTIILLGRKIIK